MQDEEMNNGALTPIGTDTNLATTACDGGGFLGSFDAGGHKIAGYDIADDSTVIYGPATIFGCVTPANITNIASLSPLSVADICGDLTTPRTGTAELLAYRKTATSGYSRLICHPTELTADPTYIRSNLGGTYLLGRAIDMKDEDMNNQTLTPIGDDSDTSTICDAGVGFSGSFDAGGHKIAGYDIADGSGVVYGPATIFGCVVTPANITGIARPFSVIGCRYMRRPYYGKNGNPVTCLSRDGNIRVQPAHLPSNGVKFYHSLYTHSLRFK